MRALIDCLSSTHHHNSNMQPPIRVARPIAEFLEVGSKRKHSAVQHCQRQQRAPPARKQARQHAVKRGPERLRLAGADGRSHERLYYFKVPRSCGNSSRRRDGRFGRVGGGQVDLERDVAERDGGRVQELLIYGAEELQVVWSRSVS